MTLREALAAAERRLAAVGCETPGLDARVLLAHVTGCDEAGLLAHDHEPLGRYAAGFEALVSRRERREPVAYLTGHKEFFSLRFEVTPDVLVPRPETELLVAAGLEFASASAPPLSLVDVGTGSGAIALCLAHELRGRGSDSVRTIVALDRSKRALAVARRNATRLLTDGPLRVPHVGFVQGDLSTSLAPASVDLVVSNPPYLTSEELRRAPPELAFEPRLALDGAAADGLQVVRRLIADARRVLRPGGRLLCEIGAAQAFSTSGVARGLGFADVGVLRDLAGRSRVLRADVATTR